MNVTLPNFKVKVQASKLLKQFVLEGGFDIDEEDRTGGRPLTVL